jgi:hypothetical protein
MRSGETASAAQYAEERFLNRGEKTLLSKAKPRVGIHLPTLNDFFNFKQELQDRLLRGERVTIIGPAAVLQRARGISLLPDFVQAGASRLLTLQLEQEEKPIVVENTNVEVVNSVWDRDTLVYKESLTHVAEEEVTTAEALGLKKIVSEDITSPVQDFDLKESTTTSENLFGTPLVKSEEIVDNQEEVTTKDLFD